jgi:hypothetical protein
MIEPANPGLSTDGPDGFLGFFDPADHVNFNSGAAHTHLTFGDLSVDVLVPGPPAGPSMSDWGLLILLALLILLGVAMRQPTRDSQP